MNIITIDELLGAIRAQCDTETVTEDCISVIGPLDLRELVDTLNYLIRH